MAKSKPSTLADMLLEAAARDKFTGSGLEGKQIRAMLGAAKRFVLDDAMSSFLSDLSHMPFIGVARERRPSVLDAIRYGARLPFPTVWIEFKMRSMRRRMLELKEEALSVGHLLYGDEMSKPEDCPEHVGWLVQEHPTMPSAVRAMEFCKLDDGPFAEGPIVGVPMWGCWNTTDEPLPWRARTRCGTFAHGITGYRCDHIGVLYTTPLKRKDLLPIIYDEANASPIPDTGIDDSDARGWFFTHHLNVELAGWVRHLMTFLATLNDIPCEMREVRPSHGFIAKGGFRKYLSHTSVRLTLPNKMQTITLAKRVLALARRRAHSVRGHWRVYLRGARLCEGVHAWQPADEWGHAACSMCDAWRTWIKPHERGNDRLGLHVPASFEVTHKRREG